MQPQQLEPSNKTKRLTHLLAFFSLMSLAFVLAPQVWGSLQPVLRYFVLQQKTRANETTLKPNPVAAQWDSTPVSVKFEDGKKFEVELRVLSEAYRWKLGSTTLIELGDQTKLTLDDLFTSFDIDPAFLRLGLIAIGAASREVSSESQTYQEGEAKEEARSEARAAVIGQALARRFPGTPVYQFSLGRYQGQGASTPVASSSERKVIVMVITYMDEGIDLTEGVRRALAEQDWSFKPKMYSRFQDNRVTPVNMYAQPNQTIKEGVKYFV